MKPLRASILTKTLENQIMNTYERYIATIEEETPQYVTDCEGNLHDLSGNIETKLKSLSKSLEFWEAALVLKPTDTKAKRFYKKFSDLKKQVELLIEGKEIISQV